jgi:hypothetical protein
MVSRMERSNLRPGVLRIFLAPGLWDDRVGGGERRRPTCRPDHTQKEIAARVTAALSAPIRSATTRRAATSVRHLTEVDFLESPGVLSPVSGIRTPNPLLPQGEKGVGGMRGKSARECRPPRILPKNSTPERRPPPDYGYGAQRAFSIASRCTPLTDVPT